MPLILGAAAVLTTQQFQLATGESKAASHSLTTGSDSPAHVILTICRECLSCMDYVPSENLARCLLAFREPRRLEGLVEDAESSGGRGGLPGRPSSPVPINFCRLASDATLCSLGPSKNPTRQWVFGSAMIGANLKVHEGCWLVCSCENR